MMDETTQGLPALLLRKWRQAANLTRAEAAAKLGLSTRMLAYYESAEREVPRHVMLAVRMLAAEAGLRLPAGGMDRSAWVSSVDNAVAYARGEPVVGRFMKNGQHADLRNLLILLRSGPDPDLALTDPALFRTLREAGTKAFLSGIGSLRVPDAEPKSAPALDQPPHPGICHSRRNADEESKPESAAHGIA